MTSPAPAPAQKRIASWTSHAEAVLKLPELRRLILSKIEPFIPQKVKFILSNTTGKVSNQAHFLRKTIPQACAVPSKDKLEDFSVMRCVSVQSTP